MRYIHERPRWPDFTWDLAALAEPLATVRYRQGLLFGRMSALGFYVRAEAGLTAMTMDVVKSSAIEGEKLDVAQVRSSLARRLGLEMAQGGIWANASRVWIHRSRKSPLRSSGCRASGLRDATFFGML